MWFRLRFGSFSCWNIPLLPSLWRLGIVLSANVLVYPVIHSATYKCHLPNTFCAHAAPYQHIPTSMLHCQDCAFTVVIRARFTPKHVDPIWAEQICLGLIWPTTVLSILIRLLFVFFSKGFILQLWAEEQTRVLSWMPSIEGDIMPCPSHCLSQKLWSPLMIPVPSL